MSRLRESVACVTGAATGIGRAVASRLAREGARLCLADVNETALAEAARELREAGAEVSTHVVDVAAARQVEEFARAVCELHGRADILINNAGVGLHGEVEEVSLADIEWVMGVNFWGMVYGVKHFLPVLRRQPKAYVVNMSSVFGIVAPPGHAAYAASKFAVRGFSESLRHELEGTSVQVTTVHPGGVRTEIARRARLGAAVNEAKREEEVRRFDRLAITTPERAAERIVGGMLRGETRILVGRDAAQIDLIQRLQPTRYWRTLAPIIERRTAKARER